MKSLKIKKLNSLIDFHIRMGYHDSKVYYLSKKIMRFIHDFSNKVKDPIFSKEDYEDIITKQLGTIKAWYDNNSLVLSSICMVPEEPYKYTVTIFVGRNDLPFCGNFYINDDMNVVITIPQPSLDVWGKFHDLDEVNFQERVLNVVENHIYAATYIELFMRWVKVEKIVVPKKENKRISKRIYNNNDYDVTIVDSTWYTTMIMVGDSFVNGHWRNQPYGPGRLLRKLIYIDPHRRGSYVRNAKKNVDINYNDD